MAENKKIDFSENIAENERSSERFINSLALAVQVSEKVTKHVQIVITADTEDNLRCYFDVIDPTKVPKFAE